MFDFNSEYIRINTSLIYCVAETSQVRLKAVRLHWNA